MTKAQAAARPGPIGIFGGTFDPVHHGHLRAAIEVVAACGLTELRLVPVGEPPHRPAAFASPALRVEMLRAAVAGEARLRVDDRETRRAGPSYTVDTLVALRAELGHRPLCLVLGADAFLGLESWRRWRELPELAHLIVIHRPGVELQPSGALKALLAERSRADAAALAARPAGFLRAQPVTQLDISSSGIRALVAAGGDPRYLVPDAVRDLILAHHCYQSAAGAAAGSMEARLRAKQETGITG